MPDLWPDEFGDSKIIPPLAILKEQADAITRKTKQMIVGEVRQLPVPPGKMAEFGYDFELQAPFLDDYSYSLFHVFHGIQLYPLEVTGSMLPKKFIMCANSDALTDVLKEIFGSDETKRIVNALLAQTSATRSVVSPRG